MTFSVLIHSFLIYSVPFDLIGFHFIKLMLLAPQYFLFMRCTHTLAQKESSKCSALFSRFLPICQPCSPLLPSAPTVSPTPPFFSVLHVRTLGFSNALLPVPVCAILYLALLVLQAQCIPCLLPEASLTKMSLCGIRSGGQAMLSCGLIDKQPTTSRFVSSFQLPGECVARRRTLNTLTSY